MPFYPPPPSLAPATTTLPRRDNVELQEARTEQATHAMQRLHISGQSVISLSDYYTEAGAGVVRGTAVSLAIPLDEHLRTAAAAPAVGSTTHVGPLPTATASTTATAYPPRREPLRRDSLKRREALLRGKEGSRRRQRWENGWC